MDRWHYTSEDEFEQLEQEAWDKGIQTLPIHKFTVYIWRREKKDGNNLQIPI